MNNYYDQFNQHCSDVENYSTNLTVQQAAALWCGIPSEKVSQTLRESKPLRETTEHGKSILVHPNLHCLRTRCEAIQEAIEIARQYKEYRHEDKSFSEFDKRQKAYWVDIHEKLTAIKKRIVNN